jgi:hypothetical protein
VTERITATSQCVKPGCDRPELEYVLCKDPYWRHVHPPSTPHPAQPSIHQRPTGR